MSSPVFGSGFLPAGTSRFAPVRLFCHSPEAILVTLTARDKGEADASEGAAANV